MEVMSNAAVYPIQLRSEVRPSDESAVRTIIQSTGFFHPYETDVAVELVQERLARGPASGYEFVFADAAGTPAGYACFGLIGCTQSSYDLYWIAVAADRQGLGLGRVLLEESERRIAAAGGRRVYIETSNRPLYVPTRGFYLRCGYEQEAVLKDFYAPGDDKVIYVKALRPVGQASSHSENESAQDDK